MVLHVEPKLLKAKWPQKNAGTSRASMKTLVGKPLLHAVSAGISQLLMDVAGIVATIPATRLEACAICASMIAIGAATATAHLVGQNTSWTGRTPRKLGAQKNEALRFWLRWASYNSLI